MKHLKIYENFYRKYLFNVGDIVKLKHEHQRRIFKVIERKCMGPHGAKNNINTYYVETIDDNNEPTRNGLWSIHQWEYESKIRLATPEELKDYNIEQTANKFNL